MTTENNVSNRLYHMTRPVVGYVSRLVTNSVTIYSGLRQSKSRPCKQRISDLKEATYGTLYTAFLFLYIGGNFFH